MSKPYIHAKNSVRKFGGKINDYLEIHNTMDSSKSIIGDNRHRAIFHHSFGIFAMEKIHGINYEKLQKLKDKHGWSQEEIDDILDFKKDSGVVIRNSQGKEVSVRDIAEQHILEDFGMKFIPSPQDYLQEMEMKDWMNNGQNSVPSSFKKIERTKIKRVINFD